MDLGIWTYDKVTSGPTQSDPTDLTGYVNLFLSRTGIRMPVRLKKRFTYPVRSVGSDCVGPDVTLS